MDKLTYFKSYIAIVEQGSLKNAADYLNVTPSAVSKHLSTLEQFYALDLVIRDAKHVRITAQGKIFYREAKRVLQSLAQAEDAFSQGNSALNTVLRITVSQVLTQGEFMQMLVAFSRRYTYIKLDINISNKNLDLLQHDIDFAFRGGALNDSQMRAKRLFSAQTVLCAPADMSLNLDKTQMLDLISNKLLIPSYVNLSTLRMYLQKIGIKKSLAEFTAINDAYSYKNAVLEGLGVGIFLDFFIAQELAELRLKKIEKPCNFSYKSLDINMIYHKNVNLAKSHQLFRDFVSEYFNPDSTVISRT